MGPRCGSPRLHEARSRNLVLAAARATGPTGGSASPSENSASGVRHGSVLHYSFRRRFLLLGRGFLQLVVGGLRCDTCPRVTCLLRRERLRPHCDVQQKQVWSVDRRRHLGTRWWRSGRSPVEGVGVAKSCPQHARDCAYVGCGGSVQRSPRCVPNFRRTRTDAVPKHGRSSWRARQRLQSSRSLGCRPHTRNKSPTKTEPCEATVSPKDLRSK